MPELPELEVLKDIVLQSIIGKKIKKLKLLKPYIIKNYLTGNLTNEEVKEVERRGKYIIIGLTAHKIIIHLMLHGGLRFMMPHAKIKKSAAALIEFHDHSILELSEAGSKKQAAIYVLSNADTLDKIEKLGIDPLQNDFTKEALKILLQKEQRQLKSFLCDQGNIAGIGNAYADEILWQAGISPFRITTKLDNKEIEKLYKATIYVLRWAIDRVKNQGSSEKRTFLRIHNRKGKACLKCGTIIMSIRFTDRETFYCPKCQARGKIFKDRVMSRFYR